MFRSSAQQYLLYRWWKSRNDWWDGAAECSQKNTVARPGTSKHEDGRAIVASGSPFAPVELRGKTYIPSQCNNMFIFPGVGLGASLCGSKVVTDGMLHAASVACAEAVGAAEVAKASTHRLAVLRADVVHRPCLALGAVVPCQLDAARRAHAEGKALLRIGRDAGWVDGGHKIDVKSPLLELAMRDEVEAEHIAVEGERGRRILDPQHRLLHDKVAGLRLTLLCIVVTVHVWRSARDGAGPARRYRTDAATPPVGANAAARGSSALMNSESPPWPL